MERFLFNCHIITIIIRAVNKQQGRRQTCPINQGITSAEYHHPSLPLPPQSQQGMLGAHKEGAVDINGGSVRSASIFHLNKTVTISLKTHSGGLARSIASVQVYLQSCSLYIFTLRSSTVMMISSRWCLVASQRIIVSLI